MRATGLWIVGLATAIACAGGAQVRETPVARDAGATREKPLPADEILRRAEAIRNPENSWATEVEVLSVSPEARVPERQGSYSLAACGAADTLALRQSNDETRGGVLLFSGDRTWLLRPAAGTLDAYELNSAQVRLGDWVALRIARLELRSGWQVRLLGEERYADEPCFKLELTRPSGPSAWSRILYWIGKADLRPKRLEGYADNGLLVNMIRYEGFSEGPLGTTVRRVIVEGGNPWDEIYTATFSEVRAVACDPSSFTPEGMLALREAARGKGVMEKNAAGVRIEKLLRKKT